MNATRKVVLMAFVVAALAFSAWGLPTVAAATLTFDHPTRIPDVPVAALPALEGSVPPQTALNLEYQEGRLSVTAERIPLAQLLREVARLTGIEVQGLEGLQAEVSVRFSDLPLIEGLRELLASVNYIILQARSPQEGPRPVHVRLLGWKTTALAKAVSSKEGAQPERTMAVAEAPQRVDLAALVADPDPIRRRWAVERLGDTGDDQAFIFLLKGLEDEDPAVRQAVLATLSQYGRAAIEPVKALLDREQVLPVRAAALQLLDQLSGD